MKRRSFLAGVGAALATVVARKALPPAPCKGLLAGEVQEPVYATTVQVAYDVAAGWVSVAVGTAAAYYYTLKNGVIGAEEAR